MDLQFPNKLYVVEYDGPNALYTNSHFVIVVAASSLSVAQEHVMSKIGLNEPPTCLSSGAYPTIYNSTGTVPLEVQAKILYNGTSHTLKPVKEPSTNSTNSTKKYAQILKVEPPKFKSLLFGDLKEGDIFYAIGDIDLNYNYPKDCKCIKKNDVTGEELLEDNSGISFVMSSHDKVRIKL